MNSFSRIPSPSPVSATPRESVVSGTRLFYVHDPLCGWCYAMQPAVRAVRAALQDLPIESYNVGLWVGDACRLIARGFREHLQSGVPRVEALSSVRFGESFRRNVIDNDRYVYESGTAALANQCVKILAPAKHLEFIHDCQQAFFVEGQSANDIATFIGIAATYDIDAQAFVQLFFSARVREQMQAERKQAMELCHLAGSAGVPAFLLNRGSKWLPIDHGVARVPEEFVRTIQRASAVIEAA